MHSVRLLHGHEILWACTWRYLTTSERLHIYRKTYAFLERWRMFLLHRNAKTVTAHNLADNNNFYLCFGTKFAKIYLCFETNSIKFYLCFETKFIKKYLCFETNYYLYLAINA